MRITQDTIGEAILRIFLDVRVTRAGAALFRSDLVAAWGPTGLRDRDLAAGIEWLCAERCLQRAPYAPTDDEILTVLPEGETRLTGSPHRLREWLEHLRRAWVLRSAARRIKHGAFWRRVRCSVYGFHPDFEARSRRTG